MVDCLKEFIDEEKREEITVMVGNISEKEDKYGNPYLMVDLLDGESQITARIFRMNMENADFKKGDVIVATITSSKYNGSITYIINNYIIPDQASYDKDTFVISPPINFEVLWGMYQTLVDMMHDKKIKALVSTIYTKNKHLFKYWAAAKSMHHNYRGGLLYHSVCVAKDAFDIANNYNGINTDLIIAGALLHDIGKLSELDSDELGVADYTVDGNLFGHLFIGAEMVKNEAEIINLDKDIERQLIHIILSHHDNPEWGAVKKPSTIEARIVASADYIDSQIEMIKQINKTTAPGQMSEKFIDGAKIYNPPVNG